MKTSFILNLCVLTATLFGLSSCDEAGTKAGRSKKGSSYHMEGVPPDEKSTGSKIHIVGLSPAMTAEEKGIAQSQTDAEFAWIVKSAPEGSESQFFNALTGAPLGAFRAVPGSAGIRLKAQIRAKAAVASFLKQAPPSRVPMDCRIHLPKFAAAIGMKHYPPGTVVTVFANPNFITEGKDKGYNTNGGYVPNDGMLSADPRTCLFSTQNKQTALEGQTWYWGYPSDDCFIDDSHRVGLQRFLHVYLKTQGATLAHFGPTFPAAAMAMREGHTESLSDEEPDLTMEPGMLKVIHEETPPVTIVEPKTKKTDAVKEDDAGEKKEVAKKEEPVTKPKLDTFGNPLDQDLIKAGSMKGKRLLWVTADRDTSLEGSPLLACLSEKGFSVTTVKHPVPKLSAWKELLATTDEVWLFSCGTKNELSSAHTAALVEAWKRGVALSLEGDNEPLFQEVNAVLAAVAPGSSLSGNYKAEAIIGAQATPDAVGFDGKHPIFYGIKNFWEGTSTSQVTCKGGLKPVCLDSSKGVLMAVRDKVAKEGRIIVHGGFTTFFTSYFSGKPGAGRLGVNMAGWLAGADGSPSAEVANAK